LTIYIAGVRLNEKMGIAVDGAMRTNIPGVFAAGDVTLEHMWMNVAYYGRDRSGGKCHG